MPVSPARILHPSVMLAEGLQIPEEAWLLHGELLTLGIGNHNVLITGFPVENGLTNVSFRLWPKDQPEPIRFRES